MSPYRPPLTAIYLPVSKFNRAWPGMSLVLRSAVEPQTLALQVRRMVRELDPSVAVFAVRTMETVVNDATSGARLLARLLTIFGGLAVLLALVGVYGVMAYLVSQRTHEIGVRLTLGAARGCVLKMVLSRGLKSGLTGVTLGTAGCMPLAFLMRHYLLGLNLGYVWAWAGAAAGILAVTLAATLLPAWRASQVDPLAALRDE
jgi:putative ABC transport system permease protein